METIQIYALRFKLFHTFAQGKSLEYFENMQYWHRRVWNLVDMSYLYEYVPTFDWRLKVVSYFSKKLYLRYSIWVWSKWKQFWKNSFSVPEYTHSFDFSRYNIRSKIFANESWSSEGTLQVELYRIGKTVWGGISYQLVFISTNLTIKTLEQEQGVKYV